MTIPTRRLFAHPSAIELSPMGRLDPIRTARTRSRARRA